MEVLVSKSEHPGEKCGNTGHSHRGHGRWYPGHVVVACRQDVVLSAEMGTMEVLVLSLASQATSPGAAPGSIESYKNRQYVRQP